MHLIHAQLRVLQHPPARQGQEARRDEVRPSLSGWRAGPGLYQRGQPAGGARTGSGLGFGVLIGVLWVFPHELALAGAHGDPLAYVFQNAAWHGIEQGLGGIILARLWTPPLVSNPQS